MGGHSGPTPRTSTPPKVEEQVEDQAYKSGGGCQSQLTVTMTETLWEKLRRSFGTDDEWHYFDHHCANTDYSFREAVEGFDRAFRTPSLPTEVKDQLKAAYGALQEHLDRILQAAGDESSQELRYQVKGVHESMHGLIACIESPPCSNEFLDRLQEAVTKEEQVLSQVATRG